MGLPPRPPKSPVFTTSVNLNEGLVSKDVFGISLGSFAFLIADNNESVSFTLGSFLPSFPSNSPFVAREINVV